VLEHHGDATVAWPYRINTRLSEMDLTGTWCLKAGDHPQQGRFAAAGRAQEDGELAAGISSDRSRMTSTWPNRLETCRRLRLVTLSPRLHPNRHALPAGLRRVGR
jgi:hypothetical protein